MRHTTLLLLAALPPTSVRADGPTAPNADAAYARPLHKLTEEDADRLQGRRGLFLVRADSRLVFDRDRTLYKCKSPARTLAMVWLPSRRLPEDGLAVIEATFHVYRKPAQVIRGQAFPAYTEYRLEDAVRR